MSYKALQFCVAGLVKYSGANRRKTGSRFNIQVDHGFRKRFNTILKLNKNVNSNVAEKLMGHKNGLDGVYLTPTKEQCFEEFKKAIDDLTIDDAERKKIEIERLEKKISSQEKETIRIVKMQVSRSENRIRKMLQAMGNPPQYEWMKNYRT